MINRNLCDYFIKSTETVTSKINKYDYIFIKDFYIEFQNDFNDIIDDNSYNLFLNGLSKKKDFILNIKDIDFNLMIENKYFKENPHFEIKEINYPRLLLIKDNKIIIF
jgi:hypothetical protein